MSGRNGMQHRRVKVDTTRAMVWQSMRILKVFSVGDLLRTLPEGKDSNVRKWIQALAREGYLREHGWNGPVGQPGCVKYWRLVKGIDEPLPPLVHKPPLAERTIPAERADGTAPLLSPARRAWQSMRILKVFSVGDLLRTVPEGKESSLRRWIRALVREGYLREYGWNGPAKRAGSAKYWRLVKGHDEPGPPLPHKGAPTGGAALCASSRPEELGGAHDGE